VFGFAKSQRANIDDDEEEQFKEAAKHVLALTERPSGITSKPAIEGHLKTGQRTAFRD